jgi:hypothetical protein
MFKSDLPVIKVSSYFCGSKTNRCNENKCEEGLPLLQNPSAPIWAVLQSEAALWGTARRWLSEYTTRALMASISSLMMTKEGNPKIYKIRSS